MEHTTAVAQVPAGLAPQSAHPKIVGLDEFAWRRGHRYGTIVCDLEQHRIVDLLADREIGTVTAWLKNHPGIEIVCRDRGGGYREAATHGAPQAVQITDRWHLLENASAAFLDIIDNQPSGTFSDEAIRALIQFAALHRPRLRPAPA